MPGKAVYSEENRKTHEEWKATKKKMMDNLLQNEAEKREVPSAGMEIMDLLNDVFNTYEDNSFYEWELLNIKKMLELVCTANERILDNIERNDNDARTKEKD